MLLTDVDKPLWGRSIEMPRHAANFRLVLDTAEPWGGGQIGGRVEASKPGRGGSYVVSVTCAAAWLDCPPPSKSGGPGRSPGPALSYVLMHGIGIPIWLDQQLWSCETDLGQLGDSNWLPFAFDLPANLPRAFEGTFVAFRWRIAAHRRRPVVRAVTSLPLILREDRHLPTIRVETTPIGTWRLRDSRNEAEVESAAGECSVCYEDPPSFE